VITLSAGGLSDDPLLIETLSDLIVGGVSPIPIGRAGGKKKHSFQV
jgi:hypothetical protein